jgi:hypothetical protein
VPAAEPQSTRKAGDETKPPQQKLCGGCSKLQEGANGKRVALHGFLVVLAVCWNASLCIAEPKKITEAEKNFCAEAYHKYCSEYGLESAALRNCMDRNGRALPHDCIEALIDAGEVSRGEVERRKKSGK